MIQGFHDADAGPGGVEAVVRDHSWARALGGADPYFALLARHASLDRDAVADALRRGTIRVSPAVRGCMYVLAGSQADLALSLAFHQSDKRNRRDLEKAGGTTKQIDKTAKAVLKALADGPRTTAELRKGPAGKSVTKFGDKGKKVGLSSSLPVALRQLEFDGAIERTPIDARLDTETYQWQLRERPFERLPAEDANRAIAALFFAHHGPASFEHFVAWSGLTKGAGKRAIAELELREVQVQGDGEDEDDGEGEAMLATDEALDAAHGKGKPKGEAVLGLQDPYLVVRGGPSSVCPPEHLDVEIPRWGPMRGGPIRGTKHPHLRAVLVAGELVGFWEVNASMDAQHVAWLTKPSKAAEKRVEAKVAALREFMAESLGHAKTFSIDSDKKIDERFDLVRNL